MNITQSIKNKCAFTVNTGLHLYHTNTQYASLSNVACLKKNKRCHLSTKTMHSQVELINSFVECLKSVHTHKQSINENMLENTRKKTTNDSAAVTRIEAPKANEPVDGTPV